MRETDTLDTFVDSSWYFVRFADPHAEPIPINRAAADYWLPVDQYIGGVEHAILHLLYCALLHARAAADAAMSSVDEPFAGLFTQGMVDARDLPGRRTALAASRPRSRSRDGGARRSPRHGEPVTIGALEKMSKSKKNVVDPERSSTPTAPTRSRWFMLSDSPPERDLEWTEAGVEGCWRFVQRLWRLVGEAAEIGSAARARGRRHSARRPWRSARPRTGRSPRCPRTSRRCDSTCVAHIYELANALIAAIGEVGARRD